MLAAQLISALERIGIPVVGVSIGNVDDRSTWRVDYDKPTRAQQLAGEELLASFDPDKDEDYLEERADKAFTAYLALPETQAFLKVHTDLKEAVFLDEIDSDPDFDPRGEVEDHLEIAYKKAYKDTHSRP
jgi:hypothetical protein